MSILLFFIYVCNDVKRNTERTLFLCPSCSSLFTSVMMFKRTQRETLFLCPSCSSLFTSVMMLKRTQRGHCSYVLLVVLYLRL